MKKKLFSIILIVVLVCFTFTACSSGGRDFVHRDYLGKVVHMYITETDTAAYNFIEILDKKCDIITVKGYDIGSLDEYWVVYYMS